MIIELKKALRSSNIRIILLVGFLLAVCQTVYYRFSYYPGALDNYLSSLEGGRTSGYIQPPVISQGCLGMDFTSLWEHLFYLILPLLAAVPWADSYYQEKRNGYLKMVYTKTSRMKYLSVKYASVFLLGAAAVAFPLLLSIYFSSLYLPADPIDMAMFQSNVNNYTLWGALFYENPLLYMFRYVLLDAIYGGLFAVLSLFLSLFVKKRFTVWTLLFLVNIAGYYILDFYVTGTGNYFPYYFLNAEVGAQVGLGFLLITGLLLFFVSFIGFLFFGNRDEIF